MNKQERHQYFIGILFMVTALFLIHCCSRSGIRHRVHYFDDDIEESKYMPYLCAKNGDDGVFIIEEYDPELEDLELDYSGLRTDYNVLGSEYESPESNNDINNRENRENNNI
jgi:hypothetical protein